jgi:hypothetical protein
MPLYFFRVQATPDSKVELKEVVAPDFVRAGGAGTGCMVAWN